MTRHDAFWREYRIAFKKFSQQARRVQFLSAEQTPDRAAIDAARLELERSHFLYNARRDALAERLLGTAVQRSTAA